MTTVWPIHLTYEFLRKCSFIGRLIALLPGFSSPRNKLLVATRSCHVLPVEYRRVSRNTGRPYTCCGSCFGLTEYEQPNVCRRNHKSLPVVHEARMPKPAKLKEMESVIPRAESWLLGDQYDEAVVAPEFDLEAWEREHGSVTAVTEVVE